MDGNIKMLMPKGSWSRVSRIKINNRRLRGLCKTETYFLYLCPKLKMKSLRDKIDHPIFKEIYMRYGISWGTLFGSSPYTWKIRILGQLIYSIRDKIRTIHELI
jgi:hypothetical protein